MADNQKPLSDLLSSIEQKDFSPSDVPGLENEEPKEKKSKSFLIIVLILLLLIIGVGGYYVYTNYIAKEEEPITENEQDDGLNPEKSTLEFSDIFIDMGSGNLLYMKLPKSECDDTGYEKVDENTWEDNRNLYCSSSNIVSYFEDEESMTNDFANNDPTYSQEEVTFNGKKYKYIDRYIDEDAKVVGGWVYQKEPTVKVKEFDAFKAISYFAYLGDSNDLEKDNTVAVLEGNNSLVQYCIFDISKVSAKLQGYIVFGGTASVGTERDYCEVLDEFTHFEMNLQQAGSL